MSSKLKVTIILATVVTALLTIFGKGIKATYKDLNQESDPLSGFCVGVMTDDLVERTLERLDLILPEEPIVMAVTCMDRFQYRFQCTTQDAEVEYVFRDNSGELAEGDRITIARASSRLFFAEDDSTNYINLGFVNEMIPGKRYLVFLNSRMGLTEEGYPLYCQTNELLMTPIFCYDDIPNRACEEELIDGVGISAAYKSFSGNEFFIETEEGIQKMQQYKKSLLESWER